MPYCSYLDAGIKVADGCDIASGPFAPLMGIQGANQRTSVDEALRVYTWNGAYNSHEEQLKGSIAPGMLADFVVLADGPHSHPIKDIQIVRTVVGGRTTFAA